MKCRGLSHSQTYNGPGRDLMTRRRTRCRSDQIKKKSPPHRQLFFDPYGNLQDHRQQGLSVAAVSASYVARGLLSSCPREQRARYLRSLVGVPRPVSRPVYRIGPNRLFARPLLRVSRLHPYVRTYSKCTAPQAGHHPISSHRINPAIAKERPGMDHARNALVIGQSYEVRERERQRQRQDTLFNLITR